MATAGGTMATAGGTMATAGGPGAGAGLPAGAAGSPGYGRSALFGVAFAAGWSPCIGPILGGIIGLASATASVAVGTTLLLAYAAGLAVPFLAVAMGATWVATRLGWVSRHHHAVSLVSGALLVVLGVLMITNLLARLAAFSTPFGV
jgi:cytochrome c-type biogenesis protein